MNYSKSSKRVLPSHETDSLTEHRTNRAMIDEPNLSHISTKDKVQTDINVEDDEVTEYPDKTVLDLLDDVDNLEDPLQIQLAQEALDLSNDIGLDSDDEEQAPILVEGKPEEHTVGDSVHELMAFMGLPKMDFVSWSAILLGLCEPGDYNHALDIFLADCKFRLENRGQSIQPVDAFLQGDDLESWATHDPNLDVRWDLLAAEIVDLSEGKIVMASLSKPSGPLNAILTCNWHYPTWNTMKPLWSHVMDPTNPSLRAQKAKLGLSRFVRTQNRIPIREDYQRGGVDWKESYPNWEKIEEKCLEFNRWLNRHSRLVIVVGSENAEAIDQIVDLDETVEMIEVKLNIPIVRVFGKQPSFKIVRLKATKEIRQMIFFSYHSQSFYCRDVEMQIRAYHDLIWNSVADMAMVDPPLKGSLYFLRQSEISHGNRGDDIYKNSQFHLAVRLRGNEKKSDVLLPEHVVKRVFRKTINKRPELSLAPDNTSSFVRSVLKFFISRARSIINSPEWRKSAQYERMYRSHVQNLEVGRPAGLARGRATRQTEAYKGSTAGRNSAASLKRSATLPRNKQSERIAALLKVKQVKERRDANPQDLDINQQAMQDRIRRLQTMDKKELGSFFRRFVVWWAPWQPTGLHYEGDGSSGPDNFPYDTQDHPAVNVERTFKSLEKKAFLVAEARIEDDEE